MGVHAVPTFGSVLDALVVRALRRDIPSDVAARAREATERAIALQAHQTVSLSTRRRTEAYFTSVVQRVAARGGAGPRATARLVAAAIVDDLREGGRDGENIWAELERGWGGRLPADVLEEYRMQLCG
jgi:hypothetical protein